MKLNQTNKKSGTLEVFPFYSQAVEHVFSNKNSMKILLVLLINGFVAGVSLANERPYFEKGELSEEITKYVSAVSADLNNRYNVQPDRVFFLFNGEQNLLDQMVDLFSSAQAHPGVVAFLDGKENCFIYGDEMRFCNEEEEQRVQSLIVANNHQQENGADSMQSADLSNCGGKNMADWMEENPEIVVVTVAVAATGAVLFFVPALTTVGASLVVGTGLMSVSGALYAEVMHTACDNINQAVSHLMEKTD